MTADSASTANVSPLRIKQPLPRHNAVPALRRQIIDYLIEHHPPVGTWLLSDAELVRQTGVSRSTVRRSLDGLQREGWIDRQHGRGTFVGPRAALPMGSPPIDRKPHQSIVRLAVLIFRLGEWGQDWYSQTILEGIDEASDEFGVSIELLGGRDENIEALRRRIMQHPPDVLACLAPEPRHAPIIAEAQRLGVRCLGTGVRVLDLTLPAIYEDSIQGTEIAVRHLVEHGHRRIGIALPMEPTPYIFSRRMGYLRGMENAGIETDENHVCWLPYDILEGLKPHEEQYPQVLADHVHKHRLTALIGGSATLVRSMGRLVRSGSVRVPDDLSIISFSLDQKHIAHVWGDHEVSPTIIALPLLQTGRRLARLARELWSGRQVPQLTRLPCELIQGQTVARVN
jgi:DNA-binding LacI/PurR family transcriptional regulator